MGIINERKRDEKDEDAAATTDSICENVSQILQPAKPKPVAQAKGRIRGRKKKKKEEEEKVDFASFGLDNQFKEFKSLVEKWRQEKPLDLVPLEVDDPAILKPYKLKPYEPKIEPPTPDESSTKLTQSPTFNFDKFFTPHNDQGTAAPYRLPELTYQKSKAVRLSRKPFKKYWKQRFKVEKEGEVFWPEDNQEVITNIPTISLEEYEARINPVIKEETALPASIGMGSILKKSVSEQLPVKNEKTLLLQSESKESSVAISVGVGGDPRSKKQKISLQDYLRKNKPR